MFTKSSLSILTTTIFITSQVALAIPALNNRNPSEIRPKSAYPSPYVSEPKITTDFPDPCLIQTRNGQYYSFATTTFASGRTINIQAAHSADFNTWSLVTNADGSPHDALPTPGAWVNPSSPNTWAPDVIQLDNGTYVLYYAAQSSQAVNHCVGAATASQITGPYTALATPLACPISQGGAIDASGFRDPSTGQRYVLYKIDGNSIGHGGVCGNTVAPIVSTPIMLQAVASDGVTSQGSPVQILDNAGVADDGLVEAPSMIRSAKGQYILFFSKGCFSTADYDVEYAVASKITGPYTRMGPLVKTGDFGLYGPGGADVDLDGKIVFHADLGQSASVRQMYTGQIQVLANGTVVI